jgi:hypothetical protein|nr:glycosyltransferase family 39 protein [uncultured Acetatifactor sp.]
MGWDREKAVRRLYYAGNLVVRVVGSTIFLGLVWYSFRYTQYMLPGGDEIPMNVYDSVKQNILCLCLVTGGTAVLLFIERRMERRVQFLVRRVSMLAMIGWILLASLWWIHSSAHLPVGDQAFVYGGASYFIEGWYDFLYSGGYCGMYPHQLGLIVLMEGFFKIVGAHNYYAFELLCALLAAGSAYCGYCILLELTGSTTVVVSYNILMMGCLPLIFYTSWVYGDIPSIFFALTAVWMLLRYDRNCKIRYLVLVVISLVLAMMVRRQSAVMLISVCIAVLLYGILQKDRNIILAVLLTAALSWGVFTAVYKMYEIRSGHEHSKGIPQITWVTMGMQETDGVYGWYNNYPKELYYSMNFDSELTAAAAKADLYDRLKVFRNDPAYARRFFREKVLSQWNQPLYQALYFNAERPGDYMGPEEGSLADRIGGEDYLSVLRICDRVQFIIYVGMLFYFLLAVKKGSNILQHIPAITVIGGFFLSVLVEAKARYIFPYYIMMFPFAAYGWYLTIRQVMFLTDRRSEKDQIVDIEEKRKVA